MTQGEGIHVQNIQMSTNALRHLQSDRKPEMTKGELRHLYRNARNICNKQDELSVLRADEEIDLIGLMEWDDAYAWPVDIEVYSLYRKD